MYIEWINKHAAKLFFPIAFYLSCNIKNGGMYYIFLPKNVDFFSSEWYFCMYEISPSLEVFCDVKY